MVKMNIKNKKGWIRIAEAAIAIMLLASVILVSITKQVEKKDISEEMYKLQHTILEEASRNASVREAILTEDYAIIESFINERLAKGLNFTIAICNPSANCEAEVPKKEVYVNDIIISSTLQQYMPKKLKFYVWIE